MVELFSFSSGTPKEPIPEETLYAQKKCIRCKNFYIESENDICYYHPGIFIERYQVREGTEVGWTCCRVKEYHGGMGFLSNDDALSQTSQGCKMNAKHMEDIHFTRTIQSFPFYPEEAEKVETQKKLEQEKVKQQHPEIVRNIEFIKHNIKGDDSLIGLSIKYGVSIQEIKNANKLMNHEIFHLKTLIIPPSLHH